MSSLTATNTTTTTTTTKAVKGRSQQRFSAYAFYQKDTEAREKVKQSLGPEPTFGAISKAMSSTWKAMEADDRKKYDDLATAAKAETSPLVEEPTPQMPSSSPSPTQSTEEPKKTSVKKQHKRKRARTAFTLFTMDPKVKSVVHQEHPDADFGALSKIMGDKWKAMSDSDKSPYHEASNKEKEEMALLKPTVVNTVTQESVPIKKRKRARSAYTLYSSDQNVRNKIKSDHPDAVNDFGATSKLISAQWKKLSDEEKQPYVTESEKEKAEMAKVSPDKKVTESGKPRKRARSAYSLYTMDISVKTALKAANPDVAFTNFSKLVSVQWKTLSEADKQPYVEASNKEKAEMATLVSTTPVTSETTKKPKQKRAKSAYTLYSSDQKVRSAVQESNPDADFGTISKLIAAQWKCLSVEDKTPYEEASAKEKAEMAAHKEATKPKKTRAKSAYLHYSMDPTIRAGAKQANPTMSVTDLAKVLGAQWKALTDEQRKPYNEAYQKEKDALAAEKDALAAETASA